MSEQNAVMPMLNASYPAAPTTECAPIETAGQGAVIGQKANFAIRRDGSVWIFSPDNDTYLVFPRNELGAVFDVLRRVEQTLVRLDAAEGQSDRSNSVAAD
ncbi:MAG: hypothetical protein K2X55_28050 [Burkholderiaceae bacterium]|nr:hypothetical protein [Burkholderiaceae bacterium]